MLTLLYSFGSVISLHFAAQIFRYRNISYLSKLILLSVTIIPLGKLIYLPVPGMMGLKFQFLFASLIGLISIVSSGINKKMLVVLLPISIALISILFLQDFSHLFFYQYIELAGDAAGSGGGGAEGGHGGAKGGDAGGGPASRRPGEAEPDSPCQARTGSGD